MDCEWKEYKLEELLDYEQPGPYIVESTAYNDSYETPVLTPGKTFIIGKTNEKEGIYNKLPVIIFDDFTTSIQYVDFPFKVKSSAMKILTAKKDIVIPKLIFYKMQSIHIDTSTHKRQWLQTYSKIKVRIPVKKEDQEELLNEIEEMMSDLEQGIKILKKSNTQLSIYRKAVLNDAFSKITDKKNVSDFFNVSGGLTKNSKRENFEKKMPYLRVANVYYNRLDLTEIKKIGVKENEIADKTLEKNDLLFVEGNGSKEQIGRVAIWDGSIEGCLHQNHIIKARPIGNMSSKYALYYMISGFGRKQILNVSSSTSGLYTLSTEKVRKLLLPVCSETEQKMVVAEIESRLTVCAEIEKTVNETIDKFEAIKYSILRKKFKEGK